MIYCLMIGGDKEVVQHLDPIFRSIAPGVEAAPQTPGRTGEPGAAERGYLYCGPNGAGHFVKMVHNGVEYGIMAAYAEGLDIIRHANAGLVKQDVDAETTPLRDPKYYQYEIDIGDVAEVWRRGSVVASWLLDLTSEALVSDSGLEMFSGHVSDSVSHPAVAVRDLIRSLGQSGAAKGPGPLSSPIIKCAPPSSTLSCASTPGLAACGCLPQFAHELPRQDTSKAGRPA